VLAEAREALDPDDDEHSFDWLVNNGPIFHAIVDANAAACLQVLLDIDIINENILEANDYDIFRKALSQGVGNCFDVFVACPRIDPNPLYRTSVVKRSRAPLPHALHVFTRLLAHPKLDRLDPANFSRFDFFREQALRACARNQADELRGILAEARESLYSNHIEWSFSYLLNYGWLFVVTIHADAAACLKVLLECPELGMSTIKKGNPSPAHAAIDKAFRGVADCFDVLVACPRIDPNSLFRCVFIGEGHNRSGVLYVLDALLAHPKLDVNQGEGLFAKSVIDSDKSIFYRLLRHPDIDLLQMWNGRTALHLAIITQ